MSFIPGTENKFGISGLEIVKYFSHKHKLHFLKSFAGQCLVNPQAGKICFLTVRAS